jgi:hypothetical protein
MFGSPDLAVGWLDIRQKSRPCSVEHLVGNVDYVDEASHSI